MDLSFYLAELRRGRQPVVDAALFEKLTGRLPEDDDLERVNCLRAGEDGHRQCGSCPTCGLPRFLCDDPMEH